MLARFVVAAVSVPFFLCLPPQLVRRVVIRSLSFGRRCFLVPQLARADSEDCDQERYLNM